MRPKSRLILVAFACVIFTNTTSVQAEDLKRWRFVLPSGEFLTENGTIQVVEGLPSVYLSRVIYYDPYGKTPNRCAAGCTFALDTYQNEEGNTTTTASSTTTVVGVTTTTISGGSNSGTTTTSVQGSTSTSTSTSTTTTTAPSSAGPLTGWTLRIAQLSQNQIQINGCLDNTGGTTPLTITASWTVKKDGVTVGSGSGTSNGLLLSSSSNPACPTEFLANVSGLTASTAYVVTYTATTATQTVTGSRTVVTSNAPPTTTTTTTTTVAPATTTTTVTPATTTTTTTVAPTTTTAALTTSTTSPSSVTIEPTTTSSSPSKSGNTDTTEAGSGGSSSESSSNSSVVSVSTTTTAVPNGEVRASVGGVEVEVETKVENNAVTVSVGEVTAGISNANTSDNSTNGESQQGLVLSSGESADVSIDGLQPNSEVEVVIYSTPRNLGSLQVNEFGELVASIEIPSNMESGPHTLVLKGLDKFGKQIELKFGLVVYSPDAYIPVWVWFLIGLLLILLAASLVSRKNKKVIIAT